MNTIEYNLLFKDPSFNIKRNVYSYKFIHKGTPFLGKTHCPKPQ